METNKHLEDINFESLDNLDKISNRSRVVNRFFTVYIILVLLSGIVGFYLYAPFISITVGMILFVPIVIFIFIFRNMTEEKDFRNAWKKFEVVNNLEVKNENIYSYVPPAVYQPGGMLITSVLNIKLDSKPMYFSVYRTQEGHSKDKYINKMIIFKLFLNRKFPHLIVISKNNVTSLDMGNTTESYRAEGGFSDLFDIFYQKEQQIETLSVLSPDILLCISEFKDDLIIEIVQNCIYFAFKDEYINKRSIEKSINFVNKISTEISHKDKTINFVSLFDDENTSMRNKFLQSENANQDTKIMVNSTINQIALVLIGIFIFVEFSLLFIFLIIFNL